MFPFQLHSGDKVNLDFFIPVKNNSADAPWNRPLYGYWTSDYTPNEEYWSPWLKFVYSQDKDDDDWRYHYRPFLCLYQVMETAKVYWINSYEDLMKLIKRYPLVLDENLSIDFEKMSNDFDALYLSKEGFEDCRTPQQKIFLEYFPNTSFTVPSLESWDIPSLLVYKPEILHLVKEMENPHYEEID